MAIDAVQQVFREIPAASAVPQLSLTRRDRQLQEEEGNPPMEVASTEQDALHWRKNEDLQENWKQRRGKHASRRQASQGETPGDHPEEDLEAEEETSLTQPKLMRESSDLQKSIELLEEETGMLFNVRS